MIMNVSISLTMILSEGVSAIVAVSVSLHMNVSVSSCVSSISRN